MNRYVNPANAITVSRYAALPVAWWAAPRGEWQLACAALVFCATLDLFDGAVARRLGCASSFGEMLDAITDAICFGFFIALLTWYERLPLVPSLGFLALGVLNAGFRLIYARRAGRTTNYRSYAMERTVAFTAYLAGFGIVGIQPVYFAYCALGLMIVVMIHDSKRMLIDPVEAVGVSLSPLSAGQFEAFGVVMVLGIIFIWGARDIYLLRRYAREGGTGDQIFGSIMGLVMVAMGVVGLVIHYLLQR